MRIGFHGQLLDEPRVKAGFVGCGSHSFRNLYPTLQFAPVDLVATCDLDGDKASAYASQFGAPMAFNNHRELLEVSEIEAIFVVTGLDQGARPQYPDIAIECLDAGKHVWVEKPPAATTRDVERIREAVERSQKHFMTGLKKMFVPANELAKRITEGSNFGKISVVQLMYPTPIPTHDDFTEYLRKGRPVASVGSFLEHVCHPASLMTYLLGLPETLFYLRAPNGAGVATFGYASGAVATIVFSWRSGFFDDLERTTIVSDAGRHVVVDNNIRVTYHRVPRPGYGDVPDYFVAKADETTAVWQPEFSLGQLYNKGSFLLGYYNEINEFARSILDGRAPTKGTVEDAWNITRVFEAFAQGPGKLVALSDC